MRGWMQIVRVNASLHIRMMESPSFAMRRLQANSLISKPSSSIISSRPLSGDSPISPCSRSSSSLLCSGKRAMAFCCRQYTTGAAVKPSRLLRLPDDIILSSCDSSSRIRRLRASSSSKSSILCSSSSSSSSSSVSQEGNRRIALPDGAAAAEEDERLFARENVGGAIHIIMGPMFAGKTTSLLQRVQDARNAGRKVGLVKSNKDTRYGVMAVVSHDGIKLPCVAVPNLASFRAHVGEAQFKELEVIGIDEAQFFEDLLEFCQSAADIDRKTLIVAGLDGDFLRRRFGSVLDLIPLADSVTKLRACCELCGEPAAFTFRKTVDTQTEVIGGADVYMPVCRHHFVSGQIAVETARNVLHVHQASQTSEGVDPDSSAVSANSF